MFAAAELVAIAREPAIKHVDKRAYKRNLEQPRDQSSLRQRLDQLLERSRSLPRFSVARSNDLHRLRVRSRRDPRKSLSHSRLLRRNDLQLVVAVPFGKHPHHPAADLAVSVVNHRVEAAALARAWRCPLGDVFAGKRESNDLDGHTGASAPGASTVISGGCDSV